MYREEEGKRWRGGERYKKVKKIELQMEAVGERETKKEKEEERGKR
jgi:hypothetical protein